MFTGFNEYFKTLKMSADDQKGALRGISQMFGKEKVQAQELILQVGQRTAGMIQVFADANDMTVPQLLKTMELGKTTTDMVVKAGLASAKAAKEMGTLPDALKTSVSAQARFTNELKWFAHTILKIVDPALAKMFDGLAGFIKIIKPFIIGIGEIFKGIFSVIALLLSFDWKVYAGIVAAALLLITAGFYSIGGAALVAEVAVYSLGVAMKALRGAIPLVALASMIYFLGEYTKWKKDQDAGIETFTWIDLMNANIQLFFSEAELGWLNFKASAKEAEYAVRAIFNLQKPKWMETAALTREAELTQIRQFQEQTGKLVAPVTMSSAFGRESLSKRTPQSLYADITINIPNGTKLQLPQQVVPLSMGVAP